MRAALLCLLLLVPLVPLAARPASCVKTGSVCLEPAETRKVNGADVYLACWRYEDAYDCRSDSTVSNCAPLRDAGCSQLGSNCVSLAADGSCLLASYRYRCPDQPASQIQQTVCSDAFCQDGGAGCFDTTRPPDTDLGLAVSMAEATREAGVYGVNPDRLELFRGERDECSVKVLGGAVLKSCCEGSGGGAGFSNHALLLSALSAGAGIAGGAGNSALRAGSHYVYDALYEQTDSVLMDKGLSAMNNWASELNTSSSFGAYGFTFSYSVEGGFAFTGFDPTSFAAAVAIQLVTEWLSCTPAEQTYALKQGQNLCVYADSYCSNKVPILDICLEQKEVHCCFNSVLAKTVNRQGRAQLGLPANQCGGFSQAQLQALDFAAMDFSEFMASIQPHLPEAGASASQVQASVRQRAASYYGQ